ncbi:uncharacterized protein PgNI_04655 [Pyricularia grisea]|uniref:Uncharacterized protein n=1 Tax=Pyricularia grisea TaxID=148305 RepID=A0A6P8BCF8_PYRGI|nr:uncharacterized protein PgNI_04655 [Pyricularia grisea]TLD13382.1 hypothetical protein PgNI_04655 [Pyricularia grisea]
MDASSTFVIVTRPFQAIYRPFTSSHPRPAQPCQAANWMALKERPVGVVGLTSGINLVFGFTFFYASKLFFSRPLTGYSRLSTYLRELFIRAYHLSFFILFVLFFLSVQRASKVTGYPHPPTFQG